MVDVPQERCSAHNGQHVALDCYLQQDALGDAPYDCDVLPSQPTPPTPPTRDASFVHYAPPVQSIQPGPYVEPGQLGQSAASREDVVAVPPFASSAVSEAFNH